MNRREFMKLTGAGLAGILIPSCNNTTTEETNNPQRDALVRDLQREAENLEEQGKLHYLPKEGYTYEVNVWGTPVTFNLARNRFSKFGNKFKYTTSGIEGEVTVRGYNRGKLRIWENGEEVRPSEKQDLKEQERTNRVLQEIQKKHQELREKEGHVLSYTQIGKY